MSSPKDIHSKRKDEHLKICLTSSDITMTVTNGFEDVLFVHNALPEIDFSQITMESEFLGFKFNYPLFVSSMTGGTPLAFELNKKLAQVAEELHIGIGVGSQRCALVNEKLVESFRVIRDEAPNAFIAANIGAVQLNYEFTITDVQKAIEMIDANALILHLNPLQEVIQPEGNGNFKKLIPKISDLCEQLDCPIIIKEVGSGISLETGIALVNAGVKAIDVAGAGGTSWAKVEAIRAKNEKSSFPNIGDLFANWGIPTAISTMEICALKDKVDIIASGGIRHGIEATKALALGANLVGMALPLLKLANDATVRQLIEYLNHFFDQIKTTMFLVGAENLSTLQQVPLAIVGASAQWLSARGLNE